MDNYPDAVVISENRSDAQKMKEALDKREKNWKTVNKVGNVLTSIGSPVFVGSVVSPFDIDGPIVEIISGIVLVVGTLMKKFAKDELEEIKAIRTNGQYQQPVSSKIDDEDLKNIKTTFENLRQKAEQKKQGVSR